MKRDMELVRKILLLLEDRLEFDDPYIPQVDGYTGIEIVYHIKLMKEAGLVEARDCSSGDGPIWAVKSMTSLGHDFIDAARSETLWIKAKNIVKNSGGVLTLEALKIGLSMAVNNAVSGNES